MHEATTTTVNVPLGQGFSAVLGGHSGPRNLVVRHQSGGRGPRAPAVHGVRDPTPELLPVSSLHT